MSLANIAASVRARLLNVAKAQGADFDLTLTQFGLERLLYRLSISPYAERFLLKDALLFNLRSVFLFKGAPMLTFVRSFSLGNNLSKVLPLSLTTGPSPAGRGEKREAGLEFLDFEKIHS